MLFSSTYCFIAHFLDAGMSLARMALASLGAKGFGVSAHLREIQQMKRVQQGFTLIELMIVVAIVGILAAIALPAYQDYIIRSKMSEVEAALAACKTSVAEYVSAHAGTWPATQNQSGCSTTSTQYVNGGVTLGAAESIQSVSQNTGATPECTLT